MNQLGKNPFHWMHLMLEKTSISSFFLLLLLLFAFGFVSGAAADGDGVVMTQSDFQTLRAIQQDFVDPRRVLKSWNGSINGACSGEWIGITCLKGEVVSLNLPWKGLGGNISEKIGQLQSLRRLSLHDNYLAGPLPDSLGLLPYLRAVYLFNNRLSGSIPLSLAQSSGLQTLHLGNNNLTGTIPPILSNSTRIYRLNLSFNLLSGSIPSSLTRSPSLNFLCLQYNNLSGSVPDSWGGGQEEGGKGYQLQVLSLDHNNLSGYLPESIGNISGINQLDFSYNNFTGIIPISLSHLGNLTYFNVSYNHLSGIVPTILSKEFNSSSFVGNLQLCGYIGSSPCASPPPQVPPSPSPEGLQHGSRKLSTKDIILIAAGALLLALILLLCCLLLCCLSRRRAKKAKNGKSPGRVEKKAVTASRGEVESGGGEVGGKLVHFDGPFVFAADDLLCATAEIMGKSTYGTIYKATLEDGNQVGVKRLREKVAKGQKEFELEVVALGKIRHPNVLALRAYYLGPKGEKLLVFDYMPNGSLASFLHARGPEAVVNWSTRMSMAMGITRGLCYLHNEENIIHGNLTSSNVLLDEKHNPKISDVGLSRLMTSTANANVIATAGTQGYRAPELSKLKNANTKSDIYSLGVIILELLTGKSPGEVAATTDGVDLPQWVASIVKEEWTNEVFDVELMRDDAFNSGDELLNTLKLALHCVDPIPSARPESQQVLLQLEEIKPELAAAVSADDDGGAKAAAAGGGD